MAVYTTLVRTIVEQTYLTKIKSHDKSVLEGMTIDELLNETWQSVIPFTMTDGNGLTRENVVKAICRHYWMREIGLETVGLWKYAIGTRLQEIMPKYQEMALAQSEMGSIWESEKRSMTHSGKFANSSAEVGGNKKETSGTSGNTRDTTLTETTDGRTTNNRNITTNDTKNSTITEVGNDAHSTSHEDKEIKTNSFESTDAQSQTQTNNLEDNSTGKDTSDSTGSNVKDGNTTRITTNKDKFSDTPQNGLADVEEGKYLTEYRAVDNDVIENGKTTDTMSNNQTVDRTYKNTSTGTVGVITDSRKGGSGSDTITGTGSTQAQDIISHGKTVADTGKNDVLDDSTIIESGDKSNTGKVTDSGTTSGNETGSYSRNGNDSGTDSHTDEWQGYSGEKAKTLWEYNELYVNIYQMIIGEVAGFFMSILG